MRRTRILAIGAAAVAAGLILAGCAGGGGEPQPKSTFDPADLVETTPAGTKEVDHVTWGIHTGEPTSIDPSKAGTDSSLLVVANMCETLLLTDPSFGIEPNLATDVEWADPTTLVIDLRDDVTFWDGSPLTPADVVYRARNIHLTFCDGAPSLGDGRVRHEGWRQASWVT
jgi:peptide/nickel transport system substrate-binding protein